MLLIVFIVKGVDNLNEFDEAAFETLYNKYADMLFKISYLYTGNSNDSEDILQEVFIKYLDKSPKFNSNEHEKAWLIRTAKNKCIDLKRSKHRSSVSLNENYTEDNNAVIDDMQIAVRSELIKLDDKYKAVVYLYYYEDYSVAQIAECLKITPSNVKTRLKRARNFLKIELED